MAALNHYIWYCVKFVVGDFIHQDQNAFTLSFLLAVAHV